MKFKFWVLGVIDITIITHPPQQAEQKFNPVPSNNDPTTASVTQALVGSSYIGPDCGELGNLVPIKLGSSWINFEV